MAKTQNSRQDSETGQGIPPLGASDLVNLSVLGFGLSALSTSLGQIILPLRVLDLAPESLKNTYLGILTIVGMILAMVVQPAIGYISDRTTLRWGRRRPYMALGGTLAALFLVAIAVVNSYPWLVVVATLLQVSTNVAQNPYDAVIRDQVSARQRGRVSSIRAMAAGAGAILFTFLTGLLMGRHGTGQRDAWLWLSLMLPAAIVLVTMLWTLAHLKEKDSRGPVLQTPSANRSPPASSSGEKAHPQFIWILVAGFFFTLAGGILQTYGLYFLRDVVKLENPASAVGVLAIVVGATILLTLYPAGLLSDRMGRRPVLLTSALLGSGGTLLLFLAQDLMQVVLIGVLLGLAVGIFMSAGRALIADMVSAGRAAQQLGYANFVLVGGLAVAKLSGAGIDALNAWRPSLGYHTFMGVASGAFLVGAILVSAIKVKGHQPATAGSRAALLH